MGSFSCWSDELDGPLISVLIPVWNDEVRIRTCIQALQKQTLPAHLFEIIVLDNGSTDKTAAVVAEYPGVTLLSEPTPGSYVARNRGLRHARGHYVAFTDADCIPHPGWLEAGLSAIWQRPEVGVVAGQVIFTEPEGVYSPTCLNYERHLSMRQDRNAAKGFAITANWFSRRDLLLAMGGFDPSLKSGGDYSLARRIFDTGKRIVYAPDAIVAHPPRAHIQELMRKTRRVVGGRWASERRPRKTLWRMKVEARNFIDRSTIAVRASGMAFSERLRLLLLLTSLFIAAEVELMRLCLGKMPTRS